MIETTRSGLLIAAISTQVLFSAFFLYRVFGPLLGVPDLALDWRVMEALEIAAALGLIVGIVLGAVALRETRRRQKMLEAQLARARGAFAEVMDQRFTEWSLTPAERDVAMFTVKGLSLAEVAQARATSEGTVKAQSASIYRKAGVSGRAQLVSLFVEDLL